MQIKSAKINDHQALTTLTKSSKAHWGYSVEQMQKWKKDLTISPTYIQSNKVYKLVEQEKIIAYYSYFKQDTHIVKLDNLFVDPSHMGKGLGKYLMVDFEKRVKKENYKIITLDADPNAFDFYKKLGYKVVGQLASSVKGRYLPIMEKEI